MELLLGLLFGDSLLHGLVRVQLLGLPTIRLLNVTLIRCLSYTQNLVVILPLCHFLPLLSLVQHLAYALVLLMIVPCGSSLCDCLVPVLCHQQYLDLKHTWLSLLGAQRNEGSRRLQRLLFVATLQGGFAVAPPQARIYHVGRLVHPQRLGVQLLGLVPLPAVESLLCLLCQLGKVLDFTEISQRLCVIRIDLGEDLPQVAFGHVQVPHHEVCLAAPYECLPVCRLRLQNLASDGHHAAVVLLLQQQLRLYELGLRAVCGQLE
mmetsp:Transcript_9178/g.27569  ORF Transcript_9178/g.27569 Transcript_9178/m.27569 type:complete len:263 (+) Transcript_9178:525-1313(+)